MSNVTLVPFPNPDAFAAYLERNLNRLSVDKAAVEGTTVAEAMTAASQQIARLLPEGPHTPGHEVRAIHVQDVGPVGEVWWHLDASRTEGFLYDIYIEPQYRRQGYGRAAIMAVERELRRRGCRQLWLNVFALNQEALRFYYRLGYHVCTMHLAKRLDPPETD